MTEKLQIINHTTISGYCFPNGTIIKFFHFRVHGLLILSDFAETLWELDTTDYDERYAHLNLLNFQTELKNSDVKIDSFYNLSTIVDIDFQTSLRNLNDAVFSICKLYNVIPNKI